MEDSRDIKQIEVGILVFDNVDFLDVVGPLEVFNATLVEQDKVYQTNNLENLYNTKSLFKTKLVSYYDQNIIKTADGSKLIPDEKSKNIEDGDFKIWVIPGGKGIHKIRKDNEFIEWLKNIIDKSLVTLSVCTGAYACAQTGYLDNEIVTTHWRHLDLFQDEFPHIKLANNARYMDGHKIITAGGVSAGIDGALYLVKRTISEEHAQKAAELINYTWLG